MEKIHGTGTEPPKVELTEELEQFFLDQVCEYCGKGQCSKAGKEFCYAYEKLKKLIATAVLAERDRIMSDVVKYLEMYETDVYIITEVKKAIGGKNEEVKG